MQGRSKIRFELKSLFRIVTDRKAAVLRCDVWRTWWKGKKTLTSQTFWCYIFWQNNSNYIWHTLSILFFSLQVYERGTNVEQFVTRFLLKESANQIQSLLSSVESAVDAIDEQHSQSGWANEGIAGCYVWNWECAHVCLFVTVHMCHGIMCKTQIVSGCNGNQAVFQAQIVFG